MREGAVASMQSTPRRRGLAIPVLLFTLIMPVSGCREGEMNEPPRIEPAGVRDAARVYWVGHSLNNHVDADREGSRNMMAMVGALADADGRSYAGYDHTIWGASLRFNWQGNARWEERDDRKPLGDMAYLREHGGEWDTFVFTEVLPISGAVDWADSAYFLRSFYCEALRQRPDAEFFLYETWPNYQTPPPEAGAEWSFEAQLEAERSIWEGLADAALGDEIENPGRLGRWLSRVGVRDAHCAPSRPLRIIPGGAAMLALSRELSRLGDSAPVMEDGTTLTMGALFQNPRGEDGALRTPELPLDDIHPTEVGSYFIGLVAHASIYRADPRGLPLLVEVGDEAGALMQRIVWEVVSADPRVGVQPSEAEPSR